MILRSGQPVGVIGSRKSKARSPTINAGYSSSAVVDVPGTGTERLAVVLTNMNTGQQAEVGVYNFDFANVTYTTVREDVNGAFDSVGAFPTEAPTEPPTEAPTDAPATFYIEPVTDPPVYTDAPVTDAPDPVTDPDPVEDLTNPPAPVIPE